MRQIPPALVVSLCALSAFVGNLRGDDWPQWRGPNRDGVSVEKGLLKQWPKEGPKLLWTANTLGVGYSGPAIVGDKIYIMGVRDGDDVVLCLDAKTGKDVWPAPAKIAKMFNFGGNSWGAGPRATPSVSDGLVYALGGFGDLVCVEAATGKEVWRKSMTKDLGGAVNPIQGGPGGWGYSWSPLVDGPHVICVPGGKNGLLAALDKKTGNLVWQSKTMTEEATYSSPVPMEVGGVKQYVEMTNKGVVGIDAKTGNLAWSYKRTPDYKDVVITTPVVHKDVVYVTTGMGFRSGSDLVKVSQTDSGFEAKKVWANLDLANTQGGVVLVNGLVYGHSTSKKVPGWVCQELATGKVAWNDDQKLGVGSIVAADGMLYCYDEETGAVALVEPNDKSWTEKGRVTIPQKSKLLAPNGKIWTHPVVANGCLYLRDQELLFCYDVKGK